MCETICPLLNQLGRNRNLYAFLDPSWFSLHKQFSLAYFCFQIFVWIHLWKLFVHFCSVEVHFTVRWILVSCGLLSIFFFDFLRARKTNLHDFNSFPFIIWKCLQSTWRRKHHTAMSNWFSSFIVSHDYEFCEGGHLV